MQTFFLSSYIADRVMQLNKKFDRLIKHSEISQEYQNFIIEFLALLVLFMIWKTSQTDCFNQGFLDLPSHEVCDVRYFISLKYVEYFQDFQVTV